MPIRILRSGSPDRVPAGDTALVGPLAQGHRYRRDGRADAARLDDREREACALQRDIAGTVDRGKAWPPTGSTPSSVPDRRRAAPGGALGGARSLSSAQTVGEQAGEWCPFGRSRDQADDQREDDARSLVFETTPLDAPIEILGAAVVTLDVASDKSIANLAVRLCDVHPSGESLRVSYGVLNLTHRDGHETPAPLVPGRRYQVRIQLNDAGAVLPAGHKVRLALSTSYWPMVWPSPEKATLTVLGGTLDLPVRPPRDHRCAAAAARPGDGASGAVDGDPPRCRAHR